MTGPFRVFTFQCVHPDGRSVAHDIATKGGDLSTGLTVARGIARANATPGGYGPPKLLRYHEDRRGFALMDGEIIGLTGVDGARFAAVAESARVGGPVRADGREWEFFSGDRSILFDESAHIA